MPSIRTARRAAAWNRKLHSYVGLFLLCFIWLFALSGLILNHPAWAFTQFWPDRVQSSREVAIHPPPPGDDLSRARNLMRQAGVAGEIERITSDAGGEGSDFDVRVVRPGRITDIKADFQAARATVEQIQTNGWGIIRWLHHFTGVRMDRPQMQRDWVVTRLWSLAMDAVCLGLIFLVASGLYMWYPQMQRRRWAWGFLGAGVLVSGLFLFGLGWIT